MHNVPAASHTHYSPRCINSITHTPVQENYVNHRPRLAKDDAQRLRIMAKAADAISAGDLATRVVRQQNNWTMAPFAGG
jgi:hypothetical protein